MATINLNDSVHSALTAAHKNIQSGLSIDEFAEQVITKGLEAHSESVYSQHDEDKIKSRLKDLGYIE
jgi:predicted small metal-binding protein